MLVTLEGLDGSGKTTLWERLREGSTLPEDAVFTREPTDSWYGEAVDRSLTDDDADPMAECFLYMADHAAHLAETVEPALAADCVVVSDRYADSRYAYQGVTLADVVPDPLAYVQSLHEPWSRVPDLTIYLDVDPETAVERSAAANKFEREAHLQSVRENYDRLRADDPERFVVVDADQSPDAVHATVKSILADALPEGGS